MIPKNVRPGATAEGLTGETRQFTIKANGKAFRSLIDSLYTNKVLAVVRELCSNAQDAHIEAGQTKPFLVTIPTALEPVFAVRDYGIGMSHDDVMVLYTTIFESTKEGTNEQTGQLGLGSKSPFAYTDSFSVESFTGTEKRMYLCHLGTDGIPCITHAGNTPCNEERGLRVSFAAKRESIKQFQTEMRFVAMGYDVVPTVTGMDVALPEPRMSGSNWAIYPTDTFNGDNENNYTRHYIRMGSALYPSSTSFPNVSGAFTTVVNIPIGTAEVTSSRDALSYDYETREAIRQIHQAAYHEAYDQMAAEAAVAKTRVEVAKVWSKYTGILVNLKGNALVSLRNNDYDGDDGDESDNALNGTQPGDVIQYAAHYGKSQNARRTHGRYVSALDVELLPKMTLIVDDVFNKCVRRKARIQRAALKSGPVYVFSATTPKQLKEGVKWIKSTFELRDDQIVPVTDLVDIPPERTAREARVNNGPRMLAPGQFWMIRNNGVAESEIYGQAWQKKAWPHAMLTPMSQARIQPSWDDVFWVTDKQFTAMRKKKGNLLPKARRLDVAVQETAKRNVEAAHRALLKKASTAPIEQALTYNAVKEHLTYRSPHIGLIMDRFFPDIKISESLADDTLYLAREAKLDIELRMREISAKVNLTIRELRENYPLLFGQTDRKHYEEYIRAIQSQKEAAAK